MRVINTLLLDEVSVQARTSPRLRMNYNFHRSLEDVYHRMLNAMEPGTYIRPHKHENPDKFEVFIVLRGRMAVIIFDENGQIDQYQILDPSQGVFGVDIPERTYHTLISLQEGSVAFEVKPGPYSPVNDKNYATWAPAEDDPAAFSYLNQLINRLNLK